jgi:hypothetical protein
VTAEIVDPDWETRYGHAHASLRYGAMSRPSPSTAAPEDSLSHLDWRSQELSRRVHELENPDPYKAIPYEWV